MIMSEKIIAGMKAADFTYCTAFKEGIRLSDKVQEADKTFLIFLTILLLAVFTDLSPVLFVLGAAVCGIILKTMETLLITLL